MDNESYFRTYKDNIRDDSWSSPANVRLFSKDFIREFKDKFTWSNTENRIILEMLGYEFYKEITGENYKI